MTYQWAVIGAGPAGIATVGKLLDHGVKAQEIAWVDPHFTVGDFGTLWRGVPSNTKVEKFLKFLTECSAFDYKNCVDDFALNHLDPDHTCELNLMADPLQWVTAQLRKKVSALVDVAEQIKLTERVWHITLQKSKITAKNIVLAIGAEPKTMAFTVPMVSLPDAMDRQRIHEHCQSHETIAVFGSSHSAILVLRNLVECGVRRIINFYRSPLRYAIYLNDWILFDDTGLKGPTAQWAKENIDGAIPKNLERIYSNKENIEHYLPQCDKAIYAVGFTRRHLPVVDGVGHLEYIKECGIIAPGLFGIGIAFPEAKYNPLGIHEHRVGLWKFMDYLQRVLPIWLQYSP